MALNSPRNESLKTALKTFNEKMNTASEYKQYSSDVRPAYIRQDKQKLADEYKPVLETIKKEAEKNQEYFTKQIFALRTGDLKKSSYSNAAQRQVASQEYLAALTLANNKPANLRHIIQQAAALGRNEFCYATLEILKSDSTLSSKIRTQVEYSYELCDRAFGVTDIRKQQSEQDTYVKEAANYLELLEENVETFSKRASAFVKADAIYSEHEEHRAAPVREATE